VSVKSRFWFVGPQGYLWVRTARSGGRTPYGQSVDFALLVLRVIDQTQGREFQAEKVPADEKIVSLFEEHTDIIVKGCRDVHYGHKLDLSTGRSGLILDMVIEDGNPGDSERFLPLLDRPSSENMQ
jgi:IS5 family transposase